MLRDTAPPDAEAWQALRDAALREPEALADYPLLAVLGQAPGQGSAANLGLLVEVLDNWIGQLDAELRDAMPATTDAVRNILDRVRASRAALMGVLDLARQLDEAAAMRHQAGQHPPGAVGRFVPTVRLHDEGEPDAAPGG